MLINLKTKAIKLGASEFGKSRVKGKRFYVIFKGKTINFGSDVGYTFYDHGNKKKRDAWYARHSKIQDGSGNYVINDKNSASYWSANLLW